QADQLWAALKEQFPRAFVRPLTLEQAPQVLPDGTLFVAFLVDDPQTYLFLLTAARAGAPALSAYTLPIARKALQARVDTFRQAATNPQTILAEVAAPSRSLFAQLFPEPARAAVAGAERLLISPDGPLWEVPFAALVTNAQGPPRYLGTDQAMTYTPSL